MKVPFVDLDLQYNTLKGAIRGAIDEVLESKEFIQGPAVDRFTKNFCEVHGGNHAVGVANGTSAITVALRALGIGPGDEVITSTHTFFATVEAIYEVGAEVVLCDIDPKTYCIDTSLIEGLITSKTKAILPVHIYGNPAKMDHIQSLCKKHKLALIEDCAQAHMSKFQGKAVGTFGELATFSFYPGKNLGAYGDAGLILADTPSLFQKVTMLINHGRTKKYEHELMAGNFRMDGIQAAVLDVKLRHLKNWTEARQLHARAYDEAFRARDFKVIEVPEGGECVYHIYLVEVANREAVMKHLQEKGISSGIHYPIPMHRQPAHTNLGLGEGKYPHADRVKDRILSLPIYAELTPEQRNYVIKEFLAVAENV